MTVNIMSCIAKQYVVSDEEGPVKVKEVVLSKSSLVSDDVCLVYAGSNVYVWSDPADETFIMSLYSAKDKGKINPAHNIVRRDLLDVRRTISGKVYLQCRHCAHIPRTKRGTKCSTVAPQSIAGIYRAVGRIMMFHLRHCEHVPQEMKELDPKATRDVKVTGTKKTWVESAKRMGLKDAEEGIIYCCPTTKN